MADVFNITLQAPAAPSGNEYFKINFGGVVPVVVTTKFVIWINDDEQLLGM